MNFSKFYFDTQISAGDILSGTFGTQNVLVCINDDHEIRLFKNIYILRIFNHPNIVKMEGYSSVQKPVHLVLENMAGIYSTYDFSILYLIWYSININLLSIAFIRKKINSSLPPALFNSNILIVHFLSGGSLLTYLRSNDVSLSTKKRTRMCHNVATAMEYLHRNKFIHGYSSWSAENTY